MGPDDYRVDDLGCVVRTADGCFIPVDTMNMDYEKYLEWRKTYPQADSSQKGTN